MASKAVKTPLLRAATKRNFAAKAQADPCLSPPKVETTVLPNKLVVASIENYSPISRVSVLFRAGSRNEKHDNQGASHALRIAAGLSTQCSTQFGITRNIQQIGGNLSARSDRETIAYTVETNRDDLETGLKYLGDVASKQVFKPWELSDNVPRMKYELAARPPQVRALDLLHKAAYRSGLGNSLFCPKYAVGKISSETLQHYIQCLFTTNRAAVVGVGVDHCDLITYARELCLESGEGPSKTSKYYGGEIRREKGSQLAHVAVAVEGASLKDQKEALAFACLQYALGVGPSVRWGGSCTSPLAAAVAGSGITACTSFGISALNVSYTDSGLFGFVLSCQADAGKLAVNAAVKQMRAGSVSQENFNRGKAMLSSAIWMSADGNGDLLEELGTQAVLLGSYTSAEDLAKAVECITASDVNAAAQKVAKGTMSLSAVGNLCCVPYLDQLK